MGREWVVNDNAAWCWFQDERALVDPTTDTLVVGSIASDGGVGGADRGGNLELAVVDLRTGRSQVVVLHEHLESDDHDVPALWRRRDARWLAVYARHKSDDLTRWRISEPGDPTRWGPERTFDWSPWTGGRGATYANLHELDGRLFCFVRAVNDDQCALVSDDEGTSWSYAGKLFTRPKVGYVNGYTRYASNGRRIDLVTTDHHPRDYDNSIYHGYLADGGLRRSDGSVLDPSPLEGEGLSQDGLTTVLAAGTVIAGATLRHAWTTDVRRRETDGALAAVLTARADDEPVDEAARWDRMRPIEDLRFVYARLGPEGWSTHHLAQAGPGLLPHEQDYTGLAAIDPDDIDSVYLSSPVHPATGARTDRYEIYHGRTDDEGATWRWEAVTEDSEVDNLRPIVAPGDASRVVLLWFRGEMASSQDYRCEAVVRVTAR